MNVFSRLLFKRKRVPDLINFLSFPKTGSTWVRVLLGRYFQSLWSLDHLILLEATDSERKIFASRRIPAMKVGHGPLVWVAQTAEDLTYSNVVEPYAGGPVVVITRHPLDALLSLKMQLTYRNSDRQRSVPSEFADFVNDPVLGLSKFIKFHNLVLNMPHLFVLRYEEMLANIEREIERVLRFVSAPVDSKIVADAAAYASFDNMKRLELSGQAPRYKSSGFEIFATGDRSNPDAYHVREGRVGGYREHLTPEQCAAFLQRIQAELSPVYGYSSPS